MPDFRRHLADNVVDKEPSVTEVILSVVAVAGMLSVALIAPNALQALELIRPIKKNTYERKKRVISSTISRLKRKGLIEIAEQSEGYVMCLSKKGDKVLRKYRLRDATVTTPKKWDGKWRLIIFDITEKRKSSRNWLRMELRNIGFVKLQNSVWVYPYPCEELAALLKIDMQLGRQVLYVVADSIENDKDLRKNFGL